MKLFTFEVGGLRRIGVEWDTQLVDLTATYGAFLAASEMKPGKLKAIPAEMLSFIRLGSLAMEAAKDTLGFIQKRPAVPVGEQLVYPFEAVRLLAPIPRPGKILCSGINYHSHKDENPDAELPTEPFFFAKLPSTVIGPGQPIIKPRMTQQLDYEVELAVVIGRRMKGTPEAEVMESVFGYTVLHDVSARDIQFKNNQITLGKNFDTFCPMGPCVVTADQMSEPEKLNLTASLNGKVMQSGSTKDWVFPLPRLLSFLSQIMTLEPGDVVSTGTPAGVGVFQKPQVFMRGGDVVAVEVEGIGRLENPITDEK